MKYKVNHSWGHSHRCKPRLNGSGATIIALSATAHTSGNCLNNIVIVVYQIKKLNRFIKSSQIKIVELIQTKKE